MSVGPKGCSRCDGTLTLEARLEPLGDEPGHAVYRCDTCDELEWHQERAGKHT